VSARSTRPVEQAASDQSPTAHATRFACLTASSPFGHPSRPRKTGAGSLKVNNQL
jgi:hypothetical protein